MAGDEIAHGVIGIEARDEGALASLRRVEAQFDRTMREIDRQEAEVRIGADVREFDRELQRAKRELRVLEGEKATAEVDADTEELNAKIKKARADIKFLDGLKATVEIDVEGDKEVLAAQREIAKLESQRAKAEEQYHAQRMRAIQQEARRRSALNDQMIREQHSAESAAHRMDQQRDRDIVKVTQLQREYAKLSDRIENLNKRNAFTREARVKLDIDQKNAIAKFLLVKAELNRLGAHPPVGIKTDVDRSNLGMIRRFGASMGDVVRKVAQGAAGLSTMTIRFGPFTASVKQAIVATALLAPLITDLIGGATALAGVLGTALAGSMSLASGLVMGMIANFGGMLASIKPIAKDFKIAKQATDAYNKAVLQYGANSKEAKDAQKKMNSVLDGVDPIAAKAAKGISRAGTEWHKLTDHATHRDLGNLLTHGFKALDAIMPVVARNSKRSMSIVTDSVSGIFDAMRTDAGKAGGGMLGSLGRSFNNFLAPALHAAEHLGAAFVHIGESAARLFGGRAGNALNNWAAGIDRATQPGKKLDDTITRLGNHARDVGRLLMDFGRLMTTVFNGGADSGDKLVNQLDHAFRSWNSFLKTPQGQESMSKFFDRSAQSVSSLAGALAPIAAAIGDWSNLISPFTRGILDAIGLISRLFLGLTKIVGLGGPLTALGATFATLWAVGKMAAFVAMLSRVVGLISEARRVAAGGSILGGLKTFTGGIGGALKGGGAAAGITEAASIGAAEFRSAIISGATVGAAEMRAGVAGGGAISGAEGLARSRGGVLLPRGATAAAGAETAAVASLGTAMTIAASAVVALQVGVYALGKALGQGKNSADSLMHSLDFNVKTSQQATSQYNQLRAGISQVGASYARSKIGVEQARKALDSTKKGTIEHKMALLDYRDAMRQNIESRTQWLDQSHKMAAAANTEASTAQKALKQNKAAQEALKNRIHASGRNTNPQDLEDLKKLENEQNKLAATAEAAWNRQAAAPLNAQRAYRGMIQLTGSAEQAMGRLARSAGGKDIAQKISLKFEDPNKAGQVASKAKAALQSGVGKGAVMRIIADSRNADQAIARLRSVRITPKRLQIIEEGGRHAINMVEAIIGRKLTRKEQKIVQQGGQGVLTWLSKITGHPMPTKRQLIQQQGAQSVFGWLTRIIITNIKNKNFVVAARDAATGIINSVRNGLSSLKDKIVNVFVHKHGGAATGGSFGPSEKDMVRAAARAEASGARSTTGGIYRRPTLLVGEEDRTEYVIATNPAYRKKNQAYVQMAAGELGMTVVEAAAGGTASAAGKKKKKPGGKTRRHNQGPRTGSTTRLPLTSTDSTTSDFLSQYRSNAVEAYNKVAGKVNSDDKQLESLAHQYQDTDAGRKGARQRQSITRKIARLRRDRAAQIKKIPALRRARDKAMREYQTGADLQNRIDADTQNMNTAATWFNNGDPQHGGVDQLQTWRTNKKDREDALNDLRSLYERLQKFAPARFQTDITKEIASINSDQASSSTEKEPTGPEATAPPSFDDFLQSSGLAGTLANLQRDYLLAQTNDVPDNPATIYDNENIASLSDNLSAAASLRDFFSGALGLAQSTNQPADIVKDAADAFNSARNEWQGISDTISGTQGGGATTTVGAQMMALSTARQDLYSNFGSNFNPIWTQPGSFPAAATPLYSAGAYGANPAGSGVGGTGGTIVNQNITMMEPPADPHTWSQGVAWELQAAV